MHPSHSLAYVSLALVSLAARAPAQSTARVSVGPYGVQATNTSRQVAISADGRFVAFASDADYVVANDTNGSTDVFVHDRSNGKTERVSVTSTAQQCNGASRWPEISADGRFVAFLSDASNLVSNDSNQCRDVFVHDRQFGSTERVSVSTSGAEGNSDCGGISISADGNVVAFESLYGGYVAGDTNGQVDVFVHDRTSGVTELVSLAWNGALGNYYSSGPVLSADGQRVVFISGASNFVPGDGNGWPDIFVRDRQAGTTVRADLTSTGGELQYGSTSSASISADGNFVVFHSIFDGVVPGDTNGFSDFFVRDLQLGTTELVSLGSGGVQANGHSPNSLFPPPISPDGRFVAFTSEATNLVPGDTNGMRDTFLRDRLTGTTERISLTNTGGQPNQPSNECALSDNGRFVAFESLATNLVAGDTNSAQDIFVRDRMSVGLGIDLCQPGVAGVIGCPCLNAPATAPRGCDNSAVTGGARLFSDGVASLSADTAQLISLFEPPTATSIVLQGTLEITGGAPFGQGVRCVGGTLARLYTKTAVGGSIHVPGTGDLSVSARSAALGHPLAAGASRWYAVYYRDPNVLGFCAGNLTYNITQTQRIDWGS